MGLFSDKVKVETASQVYSLGSDEAPDNNTVAQTIVSSVLSGNSANLAKNISHAMTSSYGLRQQRYYKYVADNQPERIFSADIQSEQDIPEADIIPLVETELGLTTTNTPTTWVVPAVVGPTTIDMGVDGIIDIGSVPPESGVVLEEPQPTEIPAIERVIESVVITEAVIDYAEVGYFAAAWMYENHPTILEADIVAEWDYENRTFIINWVDDGLDQSVTIPEDLTFFSGVEEGSRFLYVYYQVITETQIIQEEQVEVSPGVFETVEHIKDKSSVASPIQSWVYTLGSGNAALDALDVNSGNVGEFYPVYFLRRFGKSVRNADPTNYDQFTSAYRTLTGGQASSLLDDIEGNEDIDDIDFVYFVQGVSMGSTNQVALEYLYNFWSTMMGYQVNNEADWLNYRNLNSDDYALDERYNGITNNWLSYFQNNVLEEDPISELPKREIRLPKQTRLDFSNAEINDDGLYGRTNKPNSSRFRFELIFSYVTENIKAGKALDGTANGPLEKGTYKMVKGPGVLVWDRRTSRGSGDDDHTLEVIWEQINIPSVRLYHQHDQFSYRYLDIVGAKLKNYVYKSHAEKYFADDVVGDFETGFIIPLHEPTLANLDKAKRSSLSNSTSWLVFNAYEKVKVKWYERGFFKILVALAFVAVAFLIPGLGAALGSSVGILGTNAAVGAMLGFAGTAAAIAGALANGIVAAIVVSTIQWGATEIFGEKWGAIIGTIVSFVTMSMMAGYMQTGSLSFDFNQLFSANRVMDLANAAGDAYAKYLNAEYMEIGEDYEELQEEYEDEAKRIQEMYDNLFGSDARESFLDPMLLSESALGFSESSEMFLSRTLITGTDVKNITISGLLNYPRTSLRLPMAIY